MGAWHRVLLRSALVASVLLQPLGAIHAQVPAPKPDYSTRDPQRFIVRVYHGETVHIISVQTANGERRVDPPQPWILEQGAQVCLDVVNAHPVKYTYTLGLIVDTATPAGLKLPDVASVLAGAFKGVPLAFSQPKPPTGRQAADSKAGPPPLDYAWLNVYAGHLTHIHEQLQHELEIAASSDIPEGVEYAEGTVEKAGLRWAKRELRGVPRGEGDLGSPGLDQTLAAWATVARNGAAAAGKASQLAGTDLVNWNSMTERTIVALSAYGAAIQADWKSVSEAYSKATPVWEQCVNVGKDPMALQLSIKPAQAGGQREVGASLIHVNVEPRYSWRFVEASPLGFAIYTPDAEALTLNNGVVQREDASFRVRAGVALVTSLSSFGPQAQQNIGLMFGAGFLDATSTTGGNVDLLLGPIYRLRDLLGIGVAFSLAQRDERRGNVIIGQPLPAGIPNIEDATEKRWMPGVALAIALKGYKF